jgi:hypothetical protein
MGEFKNEKKTLTYELLCSIIIVKLIILKLNHLPELAASIRSL